jgi:hypothetical protein
LDKYPGLGAFILVNLIESEDSTILVAPTSEWEEVISKEDWQHIAFCHSKVTWVDKFLCEQDFPELAQQLYGYMAEAQPKVAEGEMNLEAYRAGKTLLIQKYFGSGPEELE